MVIFAADDALSTDKRVKGRVRARAAQAGVIDIEISQAAFVRR